MSSKHRDSLHPDNFLSRADRIKKMDIPNSSHKVIIVKPNNEGIGFRFDCYPSNILLPHIPKTTFDNTVNICHKICESTYLRRKMEEERNYNDFHQKVLAAGAFLIFVALILLIIRVYGSSDQDLLIAALILIGVTIVSTFIIALKIFFLAPKFTNIEQVTKQRLNAALEKENTEVYRQKGFEWKVAPDYYWLELHSLKEARENTHLKTTTRTITENEPLNEVIQTGD